MMSVRRVVITGVGIFSPLGVCPGRYWESLINGQSGIVPLTRFDASRFKCRLAAEVEDKYLKVKEGASAHEVKRMDRFVRYALLAAEGAVADSGIQSTPNAGDKAGMYIGVGMGGLPHIESGVIEQENKGPRWISPYLIPSLIPNMAASMIAMDHHLSCPQYTIAGSCAGGSQAIGLAFQGIRNGSFEWALAGGTEAVITPITFSGFEALRVLSPSNNTRSTPRPFDKGRDGMIIGEGAALFVLEDRVSAEARGAKIYAELSGYAAWSRSSHIALQSPGDMANCIRLALMDSGLRGSDIDCIYAQASGLKKGDGAELMALKSLFGNGDTGPAITSVKGHIGHTFAASGPFSLAALLGALRENMVSPTLNLTSTEKEYSDMNLVRQPLTMAVRHGLINSAGFGGINASLIVSRYPLSGEQAYNSINF
jgi:3-oxoacyl-[acyl-carrier-protein] synthase II